MECLIALSGISGYRFCFLTPPVITVFLITFSFSMNSFDKLTALMTKKPQKKQEARRPKN